MTDLDRYATVLGKRFQGVRGLLCSPETQQEASEAVAGYIERQLRRDFKDFADVDGLRGLYLRAKAAIDLRGGLFGSAEAIDALERLSPGTLGFEHFIEAVRCVADAGEEPRRILARLSESAVQGTRDCLTLQREHREDTECHAAFDRFRPAITRSLTEHLERACGLETAHAGQAQARETQASLLDFVVVRDE